MQYLVLTPVFLTFVAYETGLTLLAVIHFGDICQTVKDFIQETIGICSQGLALCALCSFGTAKMSKTGLGDEQINTKIIQFPAL